jgi:hypothetical protein
VEALYIITLSSCHINVSYAASKRANHGPGCVYMVHSKRV